MNLLELRAGAASAIRTGLVGQEGRTVTVGTHGGEYSLKEIQRYAQKAPAVIISVLSCDTDKSPLVTIGATAHMAAFVMDRSHAGDPRDENALDLVTRLLRILAAPGQFWGLTGCLSAPQNIRSRNLYAPDLDGIGIALWAVTWAQLVDLTDDLGLELEDFNILHVHYDLGPEPDGVLEAEDEIELNPLAEEVIAGNDADGVLKDTDDVGGAVNG